MDYVRLFQLVFRHKWLLLFVVIGATVATWFGARLKGTSFEATATLMPQPQALVTLEGVMGTADRLSNQDMGQSSSQLTRQRMQSLIALMVSPRVLGLLIAKLQLNANPSDIAKMITVEQVTPEVLRLHATAANPELATRLVNGLASTFVEFYGDLSTNAITESTRLLREQESQARKEVEKTKAQVTRYKARHGISSLSDELNGALSRLNAIRQEREAKSSQFADVSAQIRVLEARLATTPEVSRVVEKTNDSPAAEQLRTEIGVLEKDLALERAIKTEEHPRVQELKAKLTSAKQRLLQEEGRLISRVKLTPNPQFAALKSQRDDLRGQCEGLTASIRYLDTTIAGLRQEMAGYSGADLQLATLMQRFTMADQRYTTILARLRQAETNVDSIRRSSAIAIVDTSGPLNPAVDVSKGRARKLTLLAFVLSATMGIFVLAAWDYLDRRIRTTADTEALVELPVAGIIPRALPRAASQPLSRLASLMPASPEGEAYRFLSLHLLLSREDNPVRVLMMATAKPGQGATTTISNLAATLAQANRRVVLIDADLRRPSLHHLFETSNEVGLTSVLAEGLPVEKALQPTLLPNLALLPGGPISENPWVLLRSPAMEQMVQRLREIADFVLIDTPSAAAFADAFNVAPLADGVFMVVRSRHQPTGIELKIKRMFEEAGVKVFGAILNDVPMQNVESARYHQDYYGPASRSRQVEPPALTAGRR